MKLYRQDLGDYMRRWILVHPFGTVRLHHILRGDADPDPHDHPWSFVSIILRGSYTEELWMPDGDDRGVVRERTPRRWWPRFVRAEQLHRLRLTAPVWTLVFSGRRVRSWGFATPDGWVGWREYTSRKPGLDLAEYQRKIESVYGGKP